MAGRYALVQSCGKARGVQPTLKWLAWG